VKGAQPRESRIPFTVGRGPDATPAKLNAIFTAARLQFPGAPLTGPTTPGVVGNCAPPPQFAQMAW
jgi:hypothetical protein